MRQPTTCLSHQSPHRNFLKMRAMQKNTCKMHTTNKSPQLRTGPRSPLGRRAISTYLLLYQPSIVLAVHKHVHSRSQCYLQDSPHCVILCPPTTLVRGFCRAPKLLRIQSLMCQHTRCPLLCRETAKTQASEGHCQIYQRYPVTQVSLEHLSHWVLCGVLGHGQHLNILNSTKFSPAARQRQGKAMLEGLYVIHVIRSSDRKIASCSQSQKPVKDCGTAPPSRLMMRT